MTFIKDGIHIDCDGTKRWFKDGKLHRKDGPAVEWYDGTEDWYINDKPHRIGGPAVEWANGDKWWYLYSILYAEEDYKKLVSNIPLLYWNRFKMCEWL